MRLQDYEPGKDMGKDWYDWRIIHLVDEVNRLTDLLAAPPSRTYDDIMNAQREKREALIEDEDRPSMLDVVTALAEQESQDHARQEHARQEHTRDALINKTVVSEMQTDACEDREDG